MIWNYSGVEDPETIQVLKDYDETVDLNIVSVPIEIATPPTPEWKRIERKIYSPFWRAIHNVVAHPLLFLYRPLGDRLHEYTATKMYEPKPGVTPKTTDTD
jgi:hypothetical protein